MSKSGIKNAMTVDVEDYFQVSAFENNIAPDSWDRQPVRVEHNTHKVLALFAEHQVQATFFMLGWVAERFPQLVTAIVEQGHELASHGYNHQRIGTQSRQVFQQDIGRAKHLLEDIAGVEVLGYRAPSYSISLETLWAHDDIQAAGYRYSSSVYPVQHDLYGIPDAPRHAYACRDGLLEIPITTLEFKNRNVPIGGGGFFRLYPYRFSKWALNKINRDEQESALFYFHPWEVDPDQPRPAGISAKSRFRHYLNLGRMESRLNRLCHDFEWDRMDRLFLQ